MNRCVRVKHSGILICLKRLTQELKFESRNVKDKQVLQTVLETGKQVISGHPVHDRLTECRT